MYSVFVYGTLREKENHLRFMNESPCISKNCWTYGQLFDTGYGYPTMSEHSVHKTYGELYKVNKEQLRQINQYQGFVGEGEENFYERVQKTIYTELGEVEAFVYVLNTTAFLNTEISHGNWLTYQQ